MIKKIAIGLISILVLFVLIQFIPYGKNHQNPAVVAEPKWDSPATRTQFMTSCGDCHSHETKWPGYSEIAPISWVVYQHVEEGREYFNVSNWGHQKKNHSDKALKKVKQGQMPMKQYLLFHEEAKLSKSEKEIFMEGLKATFGEENPFGHSY